MKLEWKTQAVSLQWLCVETVLASTFSTEVHMTLFNQMIHKTLQRRDNDSLEWLFCAAKLGAWSNYELTPGTGTFYLSLFLLSLFQWIAAGWWSPNKWICSTVHPPSQSRIAFTENPPSALSSLVWSVSSNNKASIPFFLSRWFTGAIILWEIHWFLSVNFPSYVYCFLIQFMLSGRYFCLLQMF